MQVCELSVTLTLSERELVVFSSVCSIHRHDLSDIITEGYSIFRNNNKTLNNNENHETIIQARNTEGIEQKYNTLRKTWDGGRQLTA